MRNVLLAWELGAGFGHLNRLIAIAKQIEAETDLYFAVPASSSTERYLRSKFDRNIHVFQMEVHSAPPTQATRQAATRTLADILYHLGFADASRLERMFDAWRQVLRVCKPSLIVADFAPSLRLAADSTIPFVMVGNGYTIPPADQLLPPIRPWETTVPAESVDRERGILCQFQELRKRIDRRDLLFLADTFSGDATFVCSVPIFDPYSQYRNIPSLMPFNIPQIQCGPLDRRNHEADIFVYMPPGHPLLGALIAALNACDLKTMVFINGAGASAHWKAKAKPQISFLDAAGDLAQILPKIRLLIHHGGLGMAYAGLLAGTPQMVLPTNLEHLITSKALLGVGVAQGFSTNVNPSVQSISNTITAMATRPWQEKACRFAKSFSKHDESKSIEEVVTVCGHFLARGQRSDRPSSP